MIPTATYRLQFHKGFSFADALARADYFAALGISHIYASPILTARAGSMHGYDVIDHSRINPELGGEAGFRALAAGMRRHGLGLIVDIVPNHMAVGKADNFWWLDVLAKGRASPYARHFDIDWDVPGLEGKVLAPFLDGDPDAVLAKGDLTLVHDEVGWAFAYFDHRFPLTPEDQAALADEPPQAVSLARRHTLLARQNFVLADWREADRCLNWRRFFDITELAALRAGEGATFEAVHQKIFALYREGLIDGVRVDHIDGLADPRAYCRMLRARLEAMRPAPYVVVEKILAEDEALPGDWPIDGSTGYDFMNLVSALLHAPGDAAFDALWRRHGGDGDFEREEDRARREILAARFSGQLNLTARAFARVLAGRPEAALRQAIAELVVALRCYRDYTTGKSDSPAPSRHFSAAVAVACDADSQSAGTIAALAALFGRRDGDPLVVDALRRFHQLSAPVAAKAVEDTAFYRYGRLLSRNDVGFNPRHLSLTVSDFHSRMERKARDWPNAMLTTATHDHKRGEDARALLAVLSEDPQAWGGLADAVQAVAPAELASSDIYQMLQSLLGAWEGEPTAQFADRIAAWCRKFLREGKLRSSWQAPNERYETLLIGFVRDLLLAPEKAPLRQRLHAFAQGLAAPAERNSLIQIALRYTLPGMPDLYQGCEFWDASLVDPDNRRAVDFAARARALAGPAAGFGGRKQRLIADLARMRAAAPDFWRTASYRPLPAPEGAPLLMFLRDRDTARAMIAVLCRGDGETVSLPLPMDGLYDAFSCLPAADVAQARLFRDGLLQVFLSPGLRPTRQGSR